MTSIETHPETTTKTKLPGIAAGALVVVVSAAVSVALNAAVATAALALGASAQFMPLQFMAYTSFTVIGVIAGVLGWTIIRARSRRPAVALRRVVPTVVALSFIPDLLLGITKFQPGTTWLGVGALMIMHLIVAVVTVGALSRLLPAPATRG